MDKLSFEHTQDGLPQSLGISKERAKALEKATAISMWELEHPEREGYTHSECLEAFTKHAQNPQEIAFQGFMAGAFYHSQAEEEDRIYTD